MINFMFYLVLYFQCNFFKYNYFCSNFLYLRNLINWKMFNLMEKFLNMQPEIFNHVIIDYLWIVKVHYNFLFIEIIDSHFIDTIINHFNYLLLNSVISCFIIKMIEHFSLILYFYFRYSAFLFFTLYYMKYFFQ